MILQISQTTYFGHPNKRDYVLQSVNQEEWTLIEIQVIFKQMFNEYNELQYLIYTHSHFMKIF